MSGKTYKCPFCSERATRDDLGRHIEEEHDECIPKGMTANQIVFNTINHKDHGTCVVCKRPTKWNETACKYDRLCGSPRCQKALREAYKKNMLKVHGKITLLDNPEQQEKMLANRGISHTYKFQDGGYHVYTGTYEGKALEFIDLVLGFKSTDILSPGPVIEYVYKGKKLKWITDILIIPLNLIIEVKDGGSNPNNRQMPSYREKQVAKEQMITNMGKFNYLRLTDNNFGQLLGIVAELKAQMIDDSDENKKVIININEEVEMLQESGLDKYKKKFKNFDEFCKDMHTPTDILNWTKVNNCQWPKEFNGQDRSKGLRFFWPDDILKNKIGTCIDFALFMHFFCERKHIENYIFRIGTFFRMYGGKKYQMFQHYMCIYKEGDLYYAFNYQGSRGYGMRGPFAKPEDLKDEQLAIARKYVNKVKNIIGKADDHDIYDIKYFGVIQDPKEYPVWDKFYGDEKALRDDVMFKSKYMPSLICKYDTPEASMHNDGFANFKETIAHLPESIRAKIIYAASDWFNDNESAVQEANLIPIPKPKDIKYIQSGEGIMNPYIVYDGKQYRVRVETLVFNKQGDVLIEMQDPKNLNKYGTNYKLPGGGLDKGKSLDEQAEAECNEEALVVTKNMSYTGMTYFQSYDGKYPEWQKKKLWPVGLKYEGSLVFIFVAEYAKKFTGHIEDVDKDDFYKKGKYVGVDTVDWRPEHEEAIEFYINHKNSIEEGTGMRFSEFAGPGGMTPAPDLSYVTQYGPVHRDTGTGVMDIEGYTIANDILTKNILIQDRSGMVKKENAETFFEGRKIRMFGISAYPEAMQTIKKAIGTMQPRGFFYETLTGKKLLSDDQILCDESCVEISPTDIGSETNAYIQTIAEQINKLKGKADPEFPLTNPRMIKEASIVTEGLKDVVIMENQYGVFAKNAKTGMRSAYYKHIMDIPAKVVAKKNVKRR